MITASGYSKDPSIMPEGIAITFGKEMYNEKGGLLKFLRWFENIMIDDEGCFMHRLKNKPTIEVDHIYIIVANRLYCKCFYGGYSNNPGQAFLQPGANHYVEIDWSRIYLAGPIEKPTFKRTLKGFQGFRYTTKLF